MQIIDLSQGAWACADSEGTSGQNLIFLTPENPVVEELLPKLKDTQWQRLERKS